MNRRLSLSLAVLFGVLALILPAFAGDYPLQVARNIMMYMALAVTWDMLIRSGQVSFGIAGLFGLGAYATILSVVHANFPPILSILFGGAFAGLVAFFIGFLILRLRAIYFSIVTLALSSIFMIVMQNLVEFTGGPLEAHHPAGNHLQRRHPQALLAHPRGTRGGHHRVDLVREEQDPLRAHGDPQQ